MQSNFLKKNMKHLQHFPGEIPYFVISLLADNLRMVEVSEGWGQRCITQILAKQMRPEIVNQ